KYKDNVQKINRGMMAFSLNSLAANKIAQMKEVTSRMIRSSGCPAPENTVFSKDDLSRAWNWSKPILPVVLKPNDGVMGKNVYVNIGSFEEFKSCFSEIIKNHSTFLIEQFHHGKEYRFTF